MQTLPNPAAPTALSPHHLSPAQVEAFDRDGYLHLPGRIPADLLDPVRRAAERWVDRAWSEDAAGQQDPDVHFAMRDGQRVMFRIDYVHSKEGRASLLLLGSPEVLGIAESLASSDLVPTYESLVFKAEDDGAAVAWHQDAVHPRRHRIFNIGVYLDDSLAGAGALRVLPGSQLAPRDVCQIRDDHGWAPPDMVEVEARAGDVVVHDVMVVHGSPATLGNRLRRTMYLEFRSRAQIIDEGPWDQDWVERRRRLLAPALDVHRRQRPNAVQFPADRLALDNAGSSANGETFEAELRTVHGVHTPGSYCSAGDVALP